MRDTCQVNPQPSYPMQTKVCRRCHIEKTLDLFARDNRNPDGTAARCRACANIANKLTRLANAEAYKAQQRLWRLQHLEQIRAKERARAPQRRAYYQAHPRRGRKKNPRHTLQQRLTVNLSTRVRMALEGRSKSVQTQSLLGCSVEAFRTYLESHWRQGMSWDNYGSYRVGGPMTWHIDHIRPCSAFNLSLETEQRACFHYTNMRPAWAVDNLTKSDWIMRGNRKVRGRDVRPLLIAWNGSGPIQYCVPPPGWHG